MIHQATSGVPIILFGAFDRHNFGDLLFVQIAQALLGEKDLLFAGLATRDMRGYGGHQINALAQLAACWRERRVNILHAGGELLTCDAWQAAVMLLPPEQTQQIIARFDAYPQQALEWARGELGISALAPYTVGRDLFPCAVSIAYNAVGGVDLGECSPAMRAEVLAKLRSADEVGVRDQQTQALLRVAGIAARLMPDPAVMVAELFGTAIRARSRQGEIAQIVQAFPQGYIAVQFSADFGNDETLAEIADQLEQTVHSSGYGIAFFRAGAAPWHDDLNCYRRIAQRMRVPVKIFTSLNLWDICALISSSRAYAGSSLHGRIVAMAFALPRISLRHSAQAKRLSKQQAFAAAWEAHGMPASVEVHEIADGIGMALAADSAQLAHLAVKLAVNYRLAFHAIRAALK